MSEYWKRYWATNNIIKRKNPQAQVGRTINKIPVSQPIWEYTLEFISSKIKLNKNDVILDLCAGNGLIAIPFSVKCKSVTAVDISKPLLNRINTDIYKNIIKIKSDILSIDFPDKSFNKVILYFALQHFNEKESLIIFKKVYNWLTDKGVFYIGDVPDADKIWQYFNTKDREKAYFESIIDERPIIGSWFTKEFIIKAALHLNYSSVKIVKQPVNLVNSHYRFDVILHK